MIDGIQQFAEWLAQTSLSTLIVAHGDWAIPTLQSVHIVAIGLGLASVLMIDLRVLGWAGHDQTLRQTTNRFGPWLSAALLVLLVTGFLMVVGEPLRELVNLSLLAQDVPGGHWHADRGDFPDHPEKQRAALGGDAGAPPQD